MTRERLLQQLEIEFAELRSVVDEIDAVLADTGDDDPGVIPRTVVGAFMHQFYNGIENVLKRVSVFHGIDAPDGPRSHADLLAAFGPSARDPLPRVLDPDLFEDLEPFRQFRHVFRTMYSSQLAWRHFAPGAATARSVLLRFENAVRRALDMERPA